MAWITVVAFLKLAMLLSSVDVSRSQEESDCQTAFADVGFIVDSSTSLIQSYDKEKDFIKKLAKKMNISEGRNHAAAVVFSEYANLAIPFSQNNSIASFGEAVDALPFLDSTTRIDRALQVASKEMFQGKNGMRKNSKKVLILLTDGEQTKDQNAVPPGKAIQPLYDLGASVVIIGIGSRVNKAESELRSMVQAKGALFFAANFDELRLDSFLNTIVSSARIGCFKKAQKCDSFTDIGFIMDSSGSLRSEYGKEKEFVKLLAESFGLSKDGPRGGLITFSDIAQVNVRFSEFENLEKFKNAVENVPLLGTITRIDIALETARSVLFENNNSKGKPNQNLLFLLTDGSQIPEPGYTEPSIIAEAIRKSGIKLVIIGIGDGISMYELNKIAGKESKVYLAKSFNDLLSEDFVTRIRNNFCEGNETITRPEKCGSADVGMVFDKTTGPNDDFQLRKELMRQLIERFNFKPRGSHPALISYANSPTLNVKFSDRSTSESVSSIVSSFNPVSGGTRLDEALQMASNQMFNYFNGMRLSSYKLLFIVTSDDGTENTNVQSYSDALKPLSDIGVRIIVIGIGLSSRFNQLRELVKHHSDLVLPRSLNGINLNTLANSVYEKSCSESGELTECSSNADIAFVLDSSTSMRENYESEKFVVKEISGSYTLSPRDTRISLVVFSDIAELVFGFNDNYDQTSLEYAIDQLQLMDSVTRIDLALNLIDSKVFTLSGGMRRFLPRVLILLTDGSQTKDYPHQDPALIAAKLRQRGIQIVAIGVGEFVKMDELIKLAGSKNNVYHARTKDDLRASEFIKKIAEKSCTFASFKRGNIGRRLLASVK